MLSTQTAAKLNSLQPNSTAAKLNCSQTQLSAAKLNSLQPNSTLCSQTQNVQNPSGDKIVGRIMQGSPMGNSSLMRGRSPKMREPVAIRRGLLGRRTVTFALGVTNPNSMSNIGVRLVPRRLGLGRTSGMIGAVGVT